MFRLGNRTQPVSVLRQCLRYNSTKSSQPQNLYILDALKSNNKLNPQKKLNTSPLDILNNQSSTRKQGSAPTKESFRNFLDQNELKAKPKDVANQLRITGPRAGKIVKVINNDIDGAFRALRSVLNANNVRGDKSDQRFYIKPGKARELKTIKNNKRVFMKGFRRLMEVVKQASRRGY